MAGLSLMPLGFVIVSSAQVPPSEAIDFLVRPRIGELLWNTTRLLVGGVLLSAAIGVGAAWLVVRTDLPRPGLWHGLLCAPLAVPAFVNGFGWVSTTHAVQSFPGAVLVVSLSYYPLVYLPAVAALRRLDSSVEDVAAGLGHRPVSAFFRVVLPAISPAVLGGSLLVGLHLLGEYGALQLLNYPTLTTAILAQYASTFNGPAATLLALVLVAFCLVLLGLELLVRGRRRHARVGAGVTRTPTRHRLGVLRLPSVGALALLLVLALGIPMLSLTRWMVRGNSTTFPAGDLWASATSTLGLAVVGGALATAAAVPVAWLAVRHRRPLGTLVERSIYPANALPGIVVALALVTISIRVVPGLYQTLPVLLLGYAILFLPRAVVSVRSTFELAPPVLEDVARSLGCSGRQVARRVTLPLLLPGLTSGMALVSLAISTELTATLLLAPTAVSTLATDFWQRAASVAYGAAAPYAVLMILLSLPATVLLARAATREVQ
ncbi:iron ABC transporter permease [Nocardioides psychrotolerans]|uniref:Iron(III) transport system permease protein n=2 Tax=Nocardioides psychrotolerans TaxID=1005945 RepID=A0A1I3QXL2_9ACTN|nr:iron ABC transporter permease [Nocardioides psychrotolerans]SFJ38490.1 iron(III) transport system permease protein [Nocardioides psychrotolerans]